MRVAIFGLGYVGTVCGACFASHGHEIVGVDVSRVKIDLINKGQSPIVEPGLDELLAQAARTGSFRATDDACEAVKFADLLLVCVGTPSKPNGALNLDYVYGVCRQIGACLREESVYKIVIIRSTVLPGTLNECRRILESESARKAGEDFGLACNPEFLREGSAITDFQNPPYTLIGSDDDRAAAMIRDLYSLVSAPVHVAPVRVAEMIKYVNNSYHALKVVFANEIGSICKALNIDSHRVMELFGYDTKLNISTTYFRPGFAFGGSCLPKDLAALNQYARNNDVTVPVLSNVLASNRAHIKNGINLVMSMGKRRIGLLGLSFKAETDDLRESPLVELVETLIGKGYDLKIYDRNVNLSKLMGANKTYIENTIPHISQLFARSLDELLAHAECVVIGNPYPEFRDALSRVREDQVVVDLVRIDPNRTTSGNYHGICW